MAEIQIEKERKFNIKAKIYTHSETVKRRCENIENITWSKYKYTHSKSHHLNKIASWIFALFKVRVSVFRGNFFEFRLHISDACQRIFSLIKSATFGIGIKGLMLQKYLMSFIPSSVFLFTFVLNFYCEDFNCTNIATNRWLSLST